MERTERALQVLEYYAGEHYPGAENTEDEDGARTVASDIIADLLHYLEQVGDESTPFRAIDLATAHYYEEREDEDDAPPLRGESPNNPFHLE